MLRDKMAESEVKDLDDCIAGAVLRESYYEHLKARYDVPVNLLKFHIFYEYQTNLSPD